MIFRIPSGKHRARPIRFGFWWRKTSFAWLVKFEESCRYNLGNDDQFDINKLIGIGYLSRPRFFVTKLFNKFWFWKLKPIHWANSARFGWRYWTDRKEIELSAYCYVKGRREIRHVCFCEIGKEYRLRLQVLDHSYYFDVYEPTAIKAAGIVTVEHFHNKKFKYRLGPFFGGNRVAPHEMKIQIEKA